ncbi:hypothetical protein PTTG_27819 [Puccinia triticina 1-1 BBBD Race 1]|uniref:Retrovirus-related Pol polyprotein from transposon TNT 1-94-like beta-barrel domain-containing protein n=1 Tax=Puccinia triticina (isolate 1-1 / race 1 (BBBD)) TaxID=630390 RepID=A0A180GI11_PUCT1|nr:hypothetical protein PTTG_27819 [Puccinia triticina 1-1 BBBD Race 1]
MQKIGAGFPATLKLQKGVAAGILGRNLGVENYAKFITKDNKKQPHLIWTALINHFQSASAQNQSVVYQDFLKIRYISNLDQFITDIDLGLSHLRLVGIQIVKMEKRTLDEHLLAEYLVNLLPSNLEYTKDPLLNKSPIDIDTVKQYLNSKSLSLNNSNPSTSSDAVTIKSESALKTVVATCQGGEHNENARHTRANCYHLHPNKAPEAYKKRMNEKNAKKKANAVTSEDVSGVYVCVSNPQALAVVQNSSLIFLDSCCSDHMFPTRRYFANYESFDSAVSVASGQLLSVKGRGLIKIKSENGKNFIVKALHTQSKTLFQDSGLAPEQRKRKERNPNPARGNATSTSDEEPKRPKRSTTPNSKHSPDANSDRIGSSLIERISTSTSDRSSPGTLLTRIGGR